MEPIEVADLDIAFPANISHLMPSYDEIPKEYKGGHTKWNQLFNDWFFFGVQKLNLVPQDGIDKQKALRHIRAILGSFEPSHEHKEAACAYLFSQWFQDAKWKKQLSRRRYERPSGAGVAWGGEIRITG